MDLVAFRRFAMLQRQNQVHAADHVIRQLMFEPMLPKEVRCKGITVEGNTLSYNQPDNDVGVYIAANALSPKKNYFEVEILDTGVRGCIGVGLVPHWYKLNRQPGWEVDSVGYHADDGRLFKANARGRPFGPRCVTGDVVGCGIRFDQMRNDDPSVQSAVTVFFTRNGVEVGTTIVMLPPEGLYPAIGMHSDGEEVRLHLNRLWECQEGVSMSIDNFEEDWARLHNVRINGQLLEYTGKGKTIRDVGLAQAVRPLNTTNHYFEIQIVDPGDNCYIAIGLTHKDYPKHRHPGWNKGSIAYHADDGKVFVGRGIGDPFGPQCHKGDTMGCGILFPCDYYVTSQELHERLEQDSLADDDDDIENDPLNDDDDTSSSEDEEEDTDGILVQVFFTRNGQTVGKREVRLPEHGFFPTVGMLSSDEKVRVDLQPLSG